MAMGIFFLLSYFFLFTELEQGIGYKKAAF